MTLSKKGLNIEPSVTLEITAKAKAMKDKGIDIISFSVGEPDFNTPINIQDEGIRAIREGLTKYTPVSGINELKKAICNKFKRDNGLEYDIENIIVSNGGKHSIYNALMAILNPNDEVIISAPYWVSYPEMVKIAGGKPVIIYTKEENDFKFNVEDLEAVKTKNTKAVILNSPSNPTGSIYTEKELRKIANWAVSNKIMVISDELYEKLIYGDYKHISIASLNEDIKKLTIVVNGMSKTYAMTGWRIGFAAAEKNIIKVMSNIQGHTTSNPTSISQYASVVGLEEDQTNIAEMKREFNKRRLYMVDMINSIEGLSCKEPKGAFYVMLNFSKLKGKTIQGYKIESSLDFTNFLLEKANVAVVPGIAFGDDNFVRLSYATSIDNINQGLKRIKKCVETR
ncbi:MAG: pyridoxal phosphate-dependent aminotransferase [Tissierellia bacterium]|nr:pyridoxal phosphate-dependent aminotransferase [Tissierellia bacterium]